MQVRIPQKPSPEQLTILQRPPRAVEIIKGAAGSGKTYTALYKLIFAHTYFWERKGSVKIQVLSFNRTLRGYIVAMMDSYGFRNLHKNVDIDISVDTFAKWAKRINNVSHFRDTSFTTFFSCHRRSNPSLPLNGKFSDEFVAEEIDYVLRRFPLDSLETYVSTRRTGRGNHPVISVTDRQHLLDYYVQPYMQWKQQHSLLDWSDIAWQAVVNAKNEYDIIVVDEGQDFTANQYRAVVNSLASESCLICVIDTAQKIYLNGFTWAECGIDAQRNSPQTLSCNFRNTVEIATLASFLLNGVEVDDDGVLPQIHHSMQHGDLPIIIEGNFRAQMDFITNKIIQYSNKGENCAIFIKNDTWTTYARNVFNNNNIRYQVITREEDWPQNDINVVISTMHSAKGLEFDHVFMPGVSEELFPSYPEEQKEYEDRDRRLLAMAIGRARNSVTIGQKPSEESKYFTNVPGNLSSRMQL